MEGRRPTRTAGAAVAAASAALALVISVPAGAEHKSGGEGGNGHHGNATPPPRPYTGGPIDTANADRCDWLDPGICLQPFPNNHFTRKAEGPLDPSTDTGLLLNLQRDSMPANRFGIHIDPAAQNLNDGFSPGSSIITKVPGLNSLEAFEKTRAVGIDDPWRYDDPKQPIVVINADTGRRHPVWAEIDFNPIDPVVCGDPPKATCEPDSVNLIIRPLVNFDEGQRYVVALRNLRDAAGATIQPREAFRVYRDNLITAQPEIEARRAHFEELFATLGRARIDRANLYLAWDFTVASERNLTERALTIRDDAFAKLGDTDLDDLTIQGDAPNFVVTSTTDFTPAEDSRIARVVEGQITVPCYLNAPGCPPGSQFVFAPGSTKPQPLPGNTTVANFNCQIPRSTLDPATPNPATPSLYGHGLLGSAGEVDAGNIKSMANEHNFIFCATDWAGFSTTDIPIVALNLQDLSNFSKLADRMQQGFVNFMYLGRAMIHPAGFSSHASFQKSGQTVIDTTWLFYDGNSQGGIMGGALTALGVDFDRSVLGVPGMNYSTLLNRSVDFEPYAEGNFTGDADTPVGLYDNYPNKLERPLIYALIQLLWDRGEANGYAHHMTDDPLPNTPPHEILLHVAFGDHQVANVAAEVEARTIGAPVYQPALDPTDTDSQAVDSGANQRHWESDGSDQIFGIPSITSFPHPGSALVYWDGGPLGFDDPFDADLENDGTATPPDQNIPPRPPAFGSDPHSYPRSDVKARAQKAAFLGISGVLRNPCTTTNNVVSPAQPIAFENGAPVPCYANGWTGAP